MYMKRKRLGFSLLETLIAVLIAAFVSIGFIGSIIFMVQATGKNRKHLNAMRTVEYFQGYVLASKYADIGKAGLPSTEHEYTINTYTPESPLTYKVDKTHASESHEFKVGFSITGYGSVIEADAFSMRVDLPDSSPAWETDEWAGNYVTITTGFGEDQIMYIKSNTADRLNVTADLTGLTDVEWLNIPKEDDTFVINNGKTVRIHLTYGDESDFETITRSVLLPYRKD